MTTMQGIAARIGELADIRRFVTADQGKTRGAIFTLEGRSSHFTFRAKQARDKQGDPIPCWTVKVLTGGSVDDGSWTYVGSLRSRRLPRFVATRGSKPESASFHAFGWFTRFVLAGPTNPAEMALFPAWAADRDFHFFHMGRCCVCSRALTHPESIKTGIGPVCASRGA